VRPPRGSSRPETTRGETRAPLKTASKRETRSATRYNQQLQEKAPQLSSNDWLRGGSTFHSLHAIARQIAPCRSKGIVTLETEGFVLRCFQTLTGIKFVLTAEKGTSSMDVVLNMVYEL